VVCLWPKSTATLTTSTRHPKMTLTTELLSQSAALLLSWYGLTGSYD